MLPDYYKTFGLSRGATREEIKKRYRLLAKQYHPDVNRDTDATAKMQEIQEAYYILSDDEARSRYDIQHDKVYVNKTEEFNVNNQNNADSTQSDKYDHSGYSFDDPILEKWILNAQRQAVDFIKNAYRDARGIAASGCLYYFKALGICVVIFILVILIIRIYTFVAS